MTATAADSSHTACRVLVMQETSCFSVTHRRGWQRNGITSKIHWKCLNKEKERGGRYNGMWGVDGEDERFPADSPPFVLFSQQQKDFKGLQGCTKRAEQRNCNPRTIFKNPEDTETTFLALKQHPTAFRSFICTENASLSHENVSCLLVIAAPPPPTPPCECPS